MIKFIFLLSAATFFTGVLAECLPMVVVGLTVFVATVITDFKRQNL